jgi:polyphenol oxidase
VVTVLRRVETETGVVFYESPLLAAAGVPHAFSTRIGGVSSGPFDSLNLGNPNGQSVQDPLENIAENYRRLQATIGCEKRARWFAHQVHGDTVLTSRDASRGDCELGKGDAVFTEDPGVVASVRTADCVPILLASSDGRQVAAVHAGWRGVVAGVATAALKRFADPSNVIAAIGPAIGFSNFEVGPEVVEAFLLLPLPHRKTGTPWPEVVKPVPGGKGYVDLRHIIVLQLQAGGVKADSIDSTDLCTVATESEFFSHRRTGGLTGRMAALIGVRA